MLQTIFEKDLIGINYLLSSLSFLSVFFAIYIIISKNPIVSVLFLIGLFFSISVYLMVIGLHFLGLVYLIVYVGAVSILFLFILMLINVRVSELLSDSSNSIPLAILTILCFNYSIDDILPYTSYLNDAFTFYAKTLANNIDNIVSVQVLNSANDMTMYIIYYLLLLNISTVSSKTWDAIVVTYSHITSIGNILYTNLFVLFIITSLILLLAMVGAIIITINKSKTDNLWNFETIKKSHINANYMGSNLDLTETVNEITKFLSQYGDFIKTFNETVNTHKISVITDSQYNMSIDVPKDMSNDVANQVTKKVYIVDNLIRSRQESLSELFSKASNLQNKSNNSELTSKLTEMSNKFKELKDSYKH